ncbi:hypothetical protein K466DRAFT_304349 [Polyporus arcularius HHB13444]|uniref:Uncharacterized protein n=1 Tax=Polyporus arcularius HHB13444 TaxID=1314778 RepID=A0A5C3NZZ4_9APHY|nr:hypothetical protein K466DRAFT_304349 [Polyporus arcularius HHB13444]
MASYSFGYKLRRLGPRDFLQPNNSESTPLPSPLFKFNGSNNSNSGGGGGGKGGDNDDDDGDGNGDDQSKIGHNQQDNQQNSHGDDDDHNQDGNDNDNDSTPSSGLFPCPANGSPNPPLPGCFTVNDGGPFLKYFGDWAVSSLDGNGKGSIHQATSPGAAVEISVDGTGFALFGIIPPSNSSNRPPAASYTVDNATSRSTQSTLPFATDCQRNQNLFQVNNLPQGNHTITVNVTSASATAPFIVDYIWICGGQGFTRKLSNSSAAQPSSTAASASSGQTHSDSHSTRSRDAIIIGSVLGSILLLLTVTLLACVCIRRRRRRQNRLRGLHLAASPVASWLRSQSGSRETGTVFTSTDSILRDNRTYSSSADTKDLEKRRNVVSMPPSVWSSSTTRPLTRPPSSQPLGMGSSIQPPSIVRLLNSDPANVTTT